MKKLIYILSIALTTPLFAQEKIQIFDETIPIVWRDGGEMSHLARDEAFALTFLTTQKVMTGEINVGWSLLTAAVASGGVEAGQAIAGHQFSVFEFLLTPAVMAANILIFDWNSSGKPKQEVREETKIEVEQLTK